jgi:hypothetical protein
MPQASNGSTASVVSRRSATFYNVSTAPNVVLVARATASNPALAAYRKLGCRSQGWAHGDTRSTLVNRTKGVEARSLAFESHQRLSSAQEKHLAAWILVQDALGVAPTHQQVKEFASRILEASGDTRPVGKHWISAFLARNPEVKSMRGKALDSARLNGATTDVIKAFFKLLDLPAIKAIKPENQHNMDETGIQEGQGSNGIFLGDARKVRTLKKTHGSRAWTTIIECISATGRALDPLVIFKGKTVQMQYFPEEMKGLDGWSFEASEKGWTDDSIALKWLKQVFIPQTKPETPSSRLLIVDGHGSHVTDDFMWECFKNDIYLIFLPPHTSHVLQPLDISVFSPLKTAYRSAIQIDPTVSLSSPYAKIMFLMAYQKARLKSLTESNIKAGFKASGMWPVSVAKPLLSRFVIIGQDTPPAPCPSTPKAVRDILSTPRHGRDVVHQFQQLLKVGTTDPARRCLFRRVGHHFDRQNTKIAEAHAKIASLEASIEQLRPRKRQKIVPTANDRFVTIDVVMKARERYARKNSPKSVQQTIRQHEFEDLCFEWQIK